MAEYKDLPDAEFDKVALRYNSQRDVYGFTTILSLSRRQQDNKCFQQILKYVTDKAAKFCNEKQKEQIEAILRPGKANNVGILMNERLINLPFEIVP